MRLLLLFVTTAFCFVACTKQQTCDAEKAVVSTMATGLGAFAGCQTTDHLAAKIQDIIDNKLKLNLCPASGPFIGTIACPLITDTLASTVLATLPPEDHCTGGASLEALKAKALALCEGVLPAFAPPPKK
jgi:hypothetical protein